MDYSEALSWCEKFIDNLVSSNVDTKRRTRGLQAMQVCKSALEKQIPKKPKKIIKSEVGIKYNCPNCDKTFMRIDINNVQWGHISKFCEICGQALDWSDTE